MTDERTENIKAAGLKSRAAMIWLRDHHLPAEPICYAIAYEYLHTDNSALKKDVDALNMSSPGIDKDLEKVFNKHIVGQDYKELTMRSGHINDYVNELLKLLVDRFESNEDLLEVVSKAKTVIEDNVEKGNTSTEEFEFGSEDESYLNTKEKATRDELTDLLDAKGFNITLGEAIQQEENHPFSLVYIDIDKFAHFNEINGKHMGDAVLKHIEKLISNFLKGSDIVGRVKGDKFCVALPKATVEQGVKVADEMRKKIAAVSLKKKASLTVAKVTVSIGVTEIRPNISIEKAMAKALVALNRSIDLGRNCVNRD